MPRVKRDTTRALELARQLRKLDDMADVNADDWDELERLLLDMDARTGRRDPSTRRKR